MQFSVYSYKDQQYKVYDDGAGHATTHAGSPTRSIFKSALGATPEQASWSVPPGAKFVGMSVLPKGRIASQTQVLGLGDIAGSSPVAVVAIVGLGYLAYRSIK